MSAFNFLFKFLKVNPEPNSFINFFKKYQQLFTKIFITILFISLFLVVGSILFFNYYQDKFYQGIFIDETYVGGLNKKEAIEKLKLLSKKETKFNIVFYVDNIKISSTSAQLGRKTSYEKSISQAFEVERVGFPLVRLVNIIRLLKKPKYFVSQTSYDHSFLVTMIDELKKQVDIEGEEPSATLKYSNWPSSLSINKGAAGRILNINKNSILIYQQLEAFEQTDLTDKAINISAKVSSTSSPLSDLQTQQALEKAKKYVGKQVKFQTKDFSVLLSDQEFINLLQFPDGANQNKLNLLMEAWRPRVNREPTNAKFSYDPNTLEVIDFIPHREGLTLNSQKTTNQIKELINQIDSNDASSEADFYRYDLQVKPQQPKITLAETNDLGIDQLIGFGDSHYEHSIPTRIHNVKTATDYLNLHIIKPGEEFRFNDTLGDVSSRTGYKPAYVISSGRTELGVGGGVCQVSTTLFRSALDAGLPISKRKAHSYRVSYYELDNKPGFDATVYGGDVDLRFINDTGHHVLIYGEADSENVYMKFELYGTWDGRSTEIVDYKMWGYNPPPAPVYIPDPSLPTGKKVQIDWSASGIKSEFTNLTKDKDGNEIRRETFYSNFRPWSAKYLVGI
jgi:vancomycin resistance protein YoaR